ncbi:sulfurtransferase [[Leptolyngbya] sp. PCC 7376]|uniref:sulfurtransferase n=1 Tax=[Leptolyngbya] sp. PCC 7376 TaxID=111781 RepID=UPI0005A0DFFD|nr:sulfurtransferase [[Leptolyngbya] sp. PCC 7376]
MTNRLAPYFVSVEKLGDRLNDPNLVIIDCRFRLNDTEWGRTQYKKSHIPGAHYLHLDEDLSSPLQKHGGRHPLPDPEKFTATLTKLGIERGKTEIVIYDDLRFAFAARLWWLLKFYGHHNVSILNGGYDAWEKANYQCTPEPPCTIKKQPFKPQMQLELLINRDALLAAEDDQWVVLDCRDAARYRGEVEPIDPIAGCIPEAMNSPWKAVSDENGFALPFEKQQELWQEYPKEQELVLYCGSGVTACVNWLSLEITGHTNLKLYAGGWSDWCSYLPSEYK